jgi:spore germination cell wall hydrolase CwlJ-like protein
MKVSPLPAAMLLAATLELGLTSTAAAKPDRSSARCLALAMYWEAKGEGRTGMLAVASVVLNRVAHREFPGSVCAVVKQGGEAPPCQFSWCCDGKSDQPTDPRAWTLAEALAHDVLTRPPPDYTEGALFFHNTNLSYPWLRKRQRTVQIGRHVFYR